MNLMKLAAKRLRRWNWIVVVAMVFGALAPGISHALIAGASPDSQLTAVCTSTGVKFVKVDAQDGSSGEPQAAIASTDCPFCQIAYVPALPVEARACLPSFVASDAPLPVGGTVHSSGGALHPIQPRAPPVSR